MTDNQPTDETPERPAPRERAARRRHPASPKIDYGASQALKSLAWSSSLSDLMPSLDQTLKSIRPTTSILSAVSSIESVLPRLVDPPVNTLVAEMNRSVARLVVPPNAGISAALTNAVRPIVQPFEGLAADVSRQVARVAAAQMTPVVGSLNEVIGRLPIVTSGAYMPRMTEWFPRLPIVTSSAYMPRLTEVLSRIPMPSIADWLPNLRPALGGLIQNHDWIFDVLRQWQDLLDGDGLASRWARAALRAALWARNAVLSGNRDEVASFIRQWLGLEHPDAAHVEAASDALLTPGWEPPDAADPDAIEEMLQTLESMTRTGARHHRPVWETQLRYGKVALLEKPVGVDPDSGYQRTLGDLLPAPADPDPFAAEITDERLHWVLRQMTAEERRVCLAYTPGLTWAEAAVAAGLPAEFGESVRRKRTRLAKEMSRRATARSGRTTQGGR
ncbi:hypothetical protein [Modestobacter sp. KNN46-3]|uniref:hypothetical protein n=1 Tax=Modestobacter sp. KNN46-3 TaxID=2711218 RepID=UPI0013DEE84E|nr:hypothetical protein [Modestobacter sp. KNN46-3]